MKKIALNKSAAPAAFCASLFLAGTALESQAQLTPGQQRQLDDFFGNRAEVGVVLGASDSASSGSYTVDSPRSGQNDLDFSLMKFGGGGEFGPARSLGSSDVTWHPVLMGSIGYIKGQNDITTGTLKGNELTETALGLQVGGGMAFHLTERFTLTPTIGMIYGRYETDFHFHNANGRAAKPFIEDDASTIGVTPGIGIGYKLPWGRNTWEFSANYTFYGTTDVDDSDFDVGGSSHVFQQRVDLDIPLNASLWDCPLHTGGYLALTEVAGDLSDTMNSDYWATIHGRILLDTTGKSWSWKMDRLGLGTSAIFGEDFTGWDIGVVATFKF